VTPVLYFQLHRSTLSKFRQSYKIFIILAIALMTGSLAKAQPQTIQAVPTPEAAGTFRNPLNVSNGPDPWLTFYDGSYYLATTTGSSELIMRKSPTLAGLKVAAPVQIYKETDPSRCCNMWAPEFHLLDGPAGKHWYYYYTAGTTGTFDNQRSYVLESAGTDPMGPYKFKAHLFDPQTDVWSIDGSILQLNNQLYFMFSSWNGPNQSLYMAPMSNPWTISGSRVLISQPTYDWEKIGLNVNEGPEALQHNGKTFIIYSASYCATPDYKLGMLTYAGGDPLSQNAWIKSDQPVFVRSDNNGVFAPGHNGFFKSPDGTEDWVVYHANTAANDGCGDLRSTRAQKINWNADGTPNFGIPVSTSDVIAAPAGDMGIDPIPDFAQLTVIRFKSHSGTAYIRHKDAYARLDGSVDPRADSQFMIVPGLADPNGISIVSANFPGRYLHHRGNLLAFETDDGSAAFKADATWYRRPGIADSASISYESQSQPGSFVGMKVGVLALVKPSELTTDRSRADATFTEEPELFSQR
jgi:GH43 family beta-xylosidase